MKKTFVTLTAALMAALLSFQVSAQEQGEVLVGSSADNWFIGFGGGVNLVFDSFKLSTPAPAAQLYFGKWFTPAIGFRAGYNGLQAKAAASPETWFSADHAFFNHFVHVDALWNLRNTKGYRENLIWNPILYLQAGGYLAHQANNHCWAFGLGGGFQNLFRISDKISISLDLSAVLAPERPYRNYTSGRFVIFPTASLGLVINLGKKFRRPVKVEVPDPNIIGNLKTQLSQTNERLANAEAQIGELQVKADKIDDLYAGRLYEFDGENLNEARPVVESHPTPEILYFELAKTTLDPRELARLEYYAQHSFKKDQRLLITGGADLGTGSLEVNKRLSKQRAEYVKGILVNQFGYNPDLLQTDADVIPSDSPIKGRIVTIEVL